MIVCKNAYNLTAAERKQCYSMSYKSEGDLIFWLDGSTRLKSNDKVVLVKENDMILGWGMRLDGGQVGVWVRSTHRRKGVGTKIINRMKKLGPLHTFPHDVRSEQFFNKNKVLKYEKLRYAVDKG